MAEFTDKEFALFTQFIYRQFGLHIKEDKKPMLAGRLQQLLMEYHLASFTDYYQYLTSDPSGKAVIALLNRITTNHTYFMREMEHFDYFRDAVLPYLEKTVKDRDLRTWSAGCSTGEEPYTLAMLMNDHFQSSSHPWDRQILASDISMNVLDKAARGAYSADKTAPLPAHWKLRYFNKINANELKINEQIRKQVIFRQFNLIQETFPFKRKFHVIFCRNVMIYFDNATKIELVRKFYEHMEYGGYLFIGHSESLQRNETDFHYVLPSIYRKV